MTSQQASSTGSTTQTFTDYKVKDISLAEFGRKEITLAEHEMPGIILLSFSNTPEGIPESNLLHN